MALSALACVVALGCTIQAPEAQDGNGAAGSTALPTGSTPAAGGSDAPAPTTTTPTGGETAAPPASTDTGTPPAGAGGASGGDDPIPTTPEAGSAATPPVEPMAGSAATPPPVVDLGEGDGTDVVTIGDSWMNYIISGGGIEGALLRAGKSYPGYGVAGTTLLSGQIPSQFTQAKRAHPNISTVIMTGGGNDIMFSGGCNTPEACEKSVQALSDGLNELWTTMSNEGVKDVVYIRYAKGAGTTNTANLPTKPPTPPVICTTGPIRCHSLDTTDLVNGELLDGIHPVPAASDRIVTALLAMMEMQGIRR